MDDAERTDLITALFAVLTARLEDGAGIATDGQSCTGIALAHTRAAQLITIGREVATIAEAAVALVSVEQAAR